MRKLSQINNMYIGSATLAIDDMKNWITHAKSVLSKPLEWNLRPENRLAIEKAIARVEDIIFFTERMLQDAKALQEVLHGEFLNIEMMCRVTTYSYASILLQKTEARESRNQLKDFDLPIIRPEREVKTEWETLQNDAEAERLMHHMIRL